MPIYEYNCDKCQSKFEKLVKNVANADNAVCPNCGSMHTSRALSVFAALSSQAGAKSSPPKGMCGRCGGPGPCAMPE
jgi:putative FmdB family regulatory protein